MNLPLLPAPRWPRARHRLEICRLGRSDVDWSRYRLALLRSTWDYIDRYAEFGDCGSPGVESGRVCSTRQTWCAGIPTRGYLLDLARKGVAIVPSTLLRPGDAINLRSCRSWW